MGQQTTFVLLWFLGCFCLLTNGVPTKSDSLQRVYENDPVSVEDAKEQSDGSEVGGPRIVNGTPTGPGKYPFMVALFSRIDPVGFLPVCGGSLITPSVVLTAAHCIFNIRSAIIGQYDFAVDEPDVEVYTDVQRRFHPLYEAPTFNFDYALVGLGRPQPDPFLINLRRTPEIPSLLTTMGWGATSFEGPTSTVLLEANVTRFMTEQCAMNYDPDEVTENMFCANEAGTDSCQGDSGGPIIVRGHNVQVGVVSWGNGCANPLFPGVYARMDTGIDWVEQTVCEEGGLAPDECVEGRLPAVDSQGRALMVDCVDMPGDFLGLGKKLLMRNCAWVGEFTTRRCPWYGDYYCPETCNVDRCSGSRR